MKKIGILTLILIVTVSCMALFAEPAYAAEIVDSGTCGTNVTWTLDDAGTLTISGSGAMTDYTSSTGMPWNSQKNAIKSVVIEEGVTSVGGYAFYGCSNLASVTIPNSVTSIGNYTFRGCNSLTSITIQDGVTRIGYYAFWDCSQLAAITIPDSVTIIDNCAFANCSRLASITIPNSVTRIGNGTFSGCSSLTSITIPDSVTSLGGSVFYYCSGLTSITIGNSVTSIGDYMFYKCSSLTYITIPNSVTSIGGSAFSGCSGLTSVTIPDSVTSIGEYAFAYCSRLTSITIPDSVASIGDYAFYNCSSLNSITLSDSVMGISDSAFSGCSCLTTITIPDSVTSIGDDAFSGCRSLTSVTIPDSVTSIGDYAFYGCSSLDHVLFTGSEAQWNAIAIGSYSSSLTSATRHYNASGDEVTVKADGTVWCKICHAPVVTASNRASDGKPVLTWTAVDGAAKYQVYRATSKNGSYSRISTTTGTKVTNTSAVAGTTYYYKVRILDENGNAGPYSAIVSRACDYARPTVTVSLNSNGKPVLTWNAVEGATQYEVYRATSKTGTYTKLSTTSGTKLTNTSAAASTTYYYKVRALGSNSSSTSAYSTVVSIKSGAAVFKITTQPASVTANTGATATFKVVASGTGLKYQWQYRTSSTGTWANATATGNATATLSVPATTSRNGYQYRCKITDGNGTVIYSNVVTLTVKSGPKITTQPASVTANVGSTATFKVVASGTGLKYQWQYRTSSTGTWANATATGNTTATLSVPATTSRNGYQYRCKITDGNGTVIYSNVVTLTVKSGPKITTQPANVTANEGSTATFKVVASGTGLTYQWQYRTSSSGTWYVSPATGATTATVSIPATTSRNGYQYRCKITDGSGTVIYSNVVTLTVKAAPKITTQPKSITAAAGGNVQFKVVASGTGLTYQWQYRTSSTGTWYVSPATGSTTATLTIPATTSRNGYQYRCKIIDSNGTVIYSNVVTLNVQ